MRKYKPWTKKAKRLLGTAPDRVIARRLGRTVRAVTFMRQALRIPCHKAHRAWAQSEITQLRAVPVLQFQTQLPALVKQFNRSPAAIRSRHRRELGLWESPKQALARKLAA